MEVISFLESVQKGTTFAKMENAASAVTVAQISCQ